jgi:hypothetical protein
VNTIICRHCGRTIALSPATHLWWATDGSEPDCPHEPQEADYMDTYRDNWKEIVEWPDGTLNLDQVARELHDYWGLMRRVAEVYGNVTGGRISKPNTLASAVITLADERINEAEREVIEDLIKGMEGESVTSTAEAVALIRELTGCAATEEP